MAAAEQKELAERAKMSVSPASSDASNNRRPVSVLTSDKERIQVPVTPNLSPDNYSSKKYPTTAYS